MAPNCYISRLPSDLLALILHRLPIADYVRSGAVSRSWRRATAGKPHPRNPKIPWLMFPVACKGSDDPDSFTFFSIADRTLRRFRLPQIRGKWIAGSSRGSIIAASANEILFLDPLIGSELLLPSATVVREDEHEDDLLEDLDMHRVVLSPSTSTAAAFCDMRCLYFARAGDHSWTAVRNEVDGLYCNPVPFLDMTFHRGEFYAVDRKGSLVSFDPAAAGTLTIHRYVDPLLNHYFRIYLVESLDGDHLLLICPVIDLASGMTFSFDIFKQDKVGLRWVEVDTLGEVAVFVGNNYSTNSTCIFTRGLPELSGNCVYFIDDLNMNIGGGRSMGKNKDDDFGVYDLDSGSIQRQHISPSSSSPLWIFPISP